MSFESIYRRVKRPNEEIILCKIQDKQPTTSSSIELDELGFPIDELGFAETEMVDIQTLNGIIQNESLLEISEKGEELEPIFDGYFVPDFIIRHSELPNYRIKYIRDFETLLLKITTYNPNLFLGHNRDHIQLTLQLEKKW